MNIEYFNSKLRILLSSKNIFLLYSVRVRVRVNNKRIREE